MKYYPIQLDIRNRNCLVVGGGDVGSRKVNGLLGCGAMVTAVSPRVTESLQKLADNGSIRLKLRSYRSSDLEEMFIVIGATDDEALNLRIYTDAGARNVLCNIADRPEVCNFILPAVVNRGDLVITISTSGKSPAYAKHLRKEMEKQYGAEQEDFLRLMGEIRKKFLADTTDKHEPGSGKKRFEALVDRGLVALIKKGDKTGVNRLLRECLGDGYEFESLLKSVASR